MAVIRQKRTTPPEGKLPAAYPVFQSLEEVGEARLYKSEERLFRLLRRTGEDAAIPLDTLRAAADLLDGSLFTGRANAGAEEQKDASGPCPVRTGGDGDSPLEERLDALLRKEAWNEEDCRSAATFAAVEGEPVPLSLRVVETVRQNPAWISVHVFPDPALPEGTGPSGRGKKPRSRRRWLLAAALLVLGALWVLYVKGSGQ